MARRLLLAIAVSLALTGVALRATAPSRAGSPASSPGQVPTLAGDPSAGAVPDAPCAPGSAPEPALQGEVPLADRQDGRSRLGYSCNLTVVGRYQGLGSSWVSQTYRHCAYMSVAFPNDLTAARPGVRVIDVADPAHPALTDVLGSPAMVSGTWESLRVNPHRGLLAAVSGGAIAGAGLFSVYDIAHDCAHPELLNSFSSTALTLPADGLGHEGGWAPDGRTYYSAGVAAGTITAIDVSDPRRPRILYTGADNVSNHGFALSDDGDTLYLASIQSGGGVDIFDVSQIQRRAPDPAIRFVGGVHWKDGANTQATIPITEHGVPYLITWDELGNGGVRFIDIADPTYPTIAGYLRLAIDLPGAQTAAAADTANTGVFGYQSHYCTVDRETDPTALACGWFQSGIRVFDIRHLAHPREIAYFNPPAQTGHGAELVDSEHAQGLVAGGGPGDLDGVSPVPAAFGGPVGSNPTNPGNAVELTADWCSSPPSWVGDELWVTCQDNGFLVLRFAPGTYPLR